MFVLSAGHPRLLGLLAATCLLVGCGPGKASNADGTGSADDGYGHGETGDGDGDGDGDEDDNPEPSDPFAPHFIAGDRLSAVGWKGPGQGFALSHIVDTELDETCAPGMAADGVLRCLPTPAEVNRYYLDDQCTQVAYELEWNTTSMLVHEPVDGEVCDGPVEVHPLVPADLSGPLWLRLAGGECESWIVVAENYDLHLAGPALAAESLVAMDRRQEHADGGLGVEQIDAADGSRFTMGTIDAQGRLCDPVHTESGTAKCVPTGQVPYVEERYAEVCNGEPIAQSPTCPAPEMALRERHDDDHRWVEPYAIGERFEGQPVYWFHDLGSSCDDALGTFWWLIGAAIPEGDLPTLHEYRHDEETVGTAWRSSPEGVLLAPGSAFPGGGAFYDPIAHNTCSPRVRTDTDEVVCAPDPRDTRTREVFTDSACTQKTAAVWFGWHQIEAGQRFGIGPSDGTVTELWEAIEPAEPPLYALSSEDQCVDTGYGDWPGLWRVEPRSLDTLAPLELMTFE